MPESPTDEYQSLYEAKKSIFRERRIVQNRRDDSLKRRLLEERRKTIVPVTNDRRQGPRRVGERRMNDRRKGPTESKLDRRTGERRVSERREYVTSNYSKEKLDKAFEERNDYNISAVMFILSFIIIFGSILFVFFTEGNL